jgi:hypothetical protein
MNKQNNKYSMDTQTYEYKSNPGMNIGENQMGQFYPYPMNTTNTMNTQFGNLNNFSQPKSDEGKQSQQQMLYGNINPNPNLNFQGFGINPMMQGFNNQMFTPEYIIYLNLLSQQKMLAYNYYLFQLQQQQTINQMMAQQQSNLTENTNPQFTGRQNMYFNPNVPDINYQSSPGILHI